VAPRRAARRLALCAALAAAGAGCAGSLPREVRVRDAIANGRYREAADAAGRGGDELLRHLDRGVALRLAGDLHGSNLHFARAEHLADDRFTRSLSKAALSLLLHDGVLPYQPDPHERLLVPFYRSLNHLAAGEPVDAAVEARRLSALLVERRDRDAARAAREGDAVLAYAAGVVLQWAGGHDDARVAYRAAAEGYGDGGFPPAAAALARLGGGTRVPDGAGGFAEAPAGSHLGEAPGGALAASAAGSSSAAPASARDPEGELVLLVERGFVAPKVEEKLFLFLHEDELDRARREPDRLAEDLAKRHLARETRRHGGIDYLIPVALPRRPAPAEPPARVVVEAGGRSLDVPLALDVTAAAARAYDADLPAILAKAAARAIVKTLVFEKATEDEDLPVRILANALHLATERADVRSWTTLPAELRLLRIPLPPGTHVLRLRVADAWGVRTLSLPPAVVEAGRLTVAAVRVP
jgi:hypothetical protein